MSISIDLSGSTAVVTGASQGIGAAIARRLHEAGAQVVINHPDQQDGKTRADAEALVAELESIRAEAAMPWIADVRDPTAVRGMMQGVKERWGGIDILVNNAGILKERSVVKLALEDWREVIEVNLSGVFHCCKYGLEVMREEGSIVCIGSLAAAAGFPGQAAYAASKGGIESLVRVVARESARRRIRVNGVAPGLVDTPLLGQVPEDVRMRLVEAVALRRLAEPREVADVVLFLCSPLSSYVTGSIYVVDGGFAG